MADKFRPNDKVMAQFRTGEPDAQMRLIPAVVIQQEDPGWYRCRTHMGVAILFAEEALSNG